MIVIFKTRAHSECVSDRLGSFPCGFLRVSLQCVYPAAYIQSVTKDTSGLMFRKSSRTWPLYTRRWRPLVINILVKAHDFFLWLHVFHSVSVFPAPDWLADRKWARAECRDVWLAPAELMIYESGKRSRGLWENRPAWHERCVNMEPRPAARSCWSLSAGGEHKVISCSLKDVVFCWRKINLDCRDCSETSLLPAGGFLLPAEIISSELNIKDEEIHHWCVKAELM